jgi:hypothetical protein
LEAQASPPDAPMATEIPSATANIAAPVSTTTQRGS